MVTERSWNAIQEDSHIVFDRPFWWEQLDKAMVTILNVYRPISSFALGPWRKETFSNTKLTL